MHFSSSSSLRPWPLKPSSSSDSLQGGGRGIPWCVCKRLGNKRKYSSTNPSFVIQTSKLGLLLDGYKARKSWLQSSKSDCNIQPNKQQKLHPKSHHSLQPNNIPQKFHPKSHHILKPNKQPKASSKSHHILQPNKQPKASSKISSCFTIEQLTKKKAFESKSHHSLQPNNKPQKLHPKSHHSLQPNNIPQKLHPKYHHSFTTQ
jgi:hypothetical protein